jgi:predicted AAA+ superfamily ATPase
MNALRSAMTELRIKSGTVVTWLDEDSTDGRFHIVPAWKWLLAE